MLPGPSVSYVNFGVAEATLGPSYAIVSRADSWIILQEQSFLFQSFGRSQKEGYRPREQKQ